MSTVKLSKKVWQDPLYFIAFGFGSGLLPFVPGTWGTLAAIPLYLLMATLPLGLYLVITLIAFAVGVGISSKISLELGIDDHSGIVWDEIVGYLLTMILAPPGVSWLIIGFVLFRIFDIWKPGPIGSLDKHIKGGWGIMLDDVAAAIPAAFILQLLAWGFR